MRARPDMFVPGAVREITLLHLGAVGVPRYEVKVRFVRMGGMIDERLWLCTEGELRGACAQLAPSEDADLLLRWLEG
jgi:hypothetical protein